MIVTRGIDIRLYPNKGQANFINKMVGATRIVYNTILYKKQKHWDEHKENLKINHNLAKSIADCSFSMIRSMLDYKCKWHNRQLIIINRWSPSSKICNSCGHIMKEWNLGIRKWICPNCGETHDRDVNAAKNILNEGMRILDTVGTTGSACGGDSSVLFESRFLMKQEYRKSLKAENQLSLAVD